MFYIDDETLLDIYAYYPYQVNTVANAVKYNAGIEIFDMLSASALGIKRADRQTISLMFSHLLSMIHLSIEKTDITPDLDNTFCVYFHGVTSGEYNLETKEINNPVRDTIIMPFIDAYNAKERICRVWVPEQEIKPEVLFSFFQSGKNKEIMQEIELTDPRIFAQGCLYQFHIILDTEKEQNVTYNVYDPFPKYGKPVGMVIETYNDGKNGKIISLIDLKDSPWAIKNYWVDCVDIWDGITNKMKVQGQENWQETFPAFEQCSLYGERWYLPAVDEAYPFLFHDRYNINEHIVKIEGGEPLDFYQSYFTSTEMSQSEVAKIYPNTGNTDKMGKHEHGKIRAFYEF